MSIKLNIAGAILLPVTLASIALLGANAQESNEANISLNEKQQARLDKALKGRTAGPAVNCIAIQDQRRMKIVSDDILVFSRAGNPKTVYVNKPVNGCRRAEGNSLTYSRPGLPLCSGNVAQIFDLRAGIGLGSCSFSEFVPYTRTDK